MTTDQKTKLQQRVYNLSLRISHLESLETHPVITDIVNEYTAEMVSAVEACNRKYEFIYNFKSGGWNTSSGYTLEEAQANVRSRFPEMDVDFKSFRLSTIGEERQLLAMFN